MNATYRIVVGVDGSEGGDRALRWAAREAGARGGATLQVVTAWSWEGPAASVPMATTPADERAHAERVAAAAADSIRAAHPKLTLATQVVEGRPSAVLAAAARDADLLVLGSHGHSRLRHVVLGSVSEEVIRGACCAVVVVPVPLDRPASTGPLAVP